MAGASTAITATETSATNPTKILLTRHITGPLNGGPVTTTTIDITHTQARLESDAAMNATVQLAAWVTVGDSDAVRGWLQNPFAGVTEFATALTSFSYTTTADSDFTVVAGDRLVVELGYSAANAVTTSYIGTIQIGGTNADLATSGTTGITTDSPWIQIGGADIATFDPQGTGGGGSFPGPLTNRTNVAFTSGTVSGVYHIYASGLDWNKKVGLLVYCDGSGDFGLNNPSSTYLMAGTNGMINVANRNNMILVTPIAPGAGCPDGDGTCWYQTSSGYTPVQKAAWSKAIVDQVYSDYDIDHTRVAMGGYSSGAQWITEYYAPAYGATTITDGVCVAISYGGSPLVTTAFTTAFKTNVPFVWDVGTADPSLNGGQGVQDGYDWYTADGFTTSLVLVSGEDHARDGQFGPVMDREILARVPLP